MAPAPDDAADGCGTLAALDSTEAHEKCVPGYGPGTCCSVPALVLPLEKPAAVPLRTYSGALGLPSLPETATELGTCLALVCCGRLLAVSGSQPLYHPACALTCCSCLCCRSPNFTGKAASVTRQAGAAEGASVSVPGTCSVGLPLGLLLANRCVGVHSAGNR